MPRKNRRLIYSGNGDAYYVYPSAIGSSELNVTTPEVFVTANPDDVARGNAQRWWKEHSNVYGEKGLEQVSPEFDLISLAPLVKTIVNTGLRSAGRMVSKAMENHRYPYRRVLAEETPSLNWADATRTPQITAENAASITPEQWTAAQDAAIARGDMAEAQRLRDLHFKVSAPNNTVVDNAGLPVHVYHGTSAKPFTIFDINASRVHDLGTYGKGFYFTPNKKTAINYGNEKHVFDSYLKLEKPYSGNMDVVDNVGNFRNLKELKNYYKQEGIPEKELNAVDWGNFDVADGVNAGDEIMVLRPNQIKLADAITYDDNGVRIPLGERDNFNLNDIRYGLLPLGIGLTGYGLSQKRLGGRVRFEMGGPIRKPMPPHPRKENREKDSAAYAAYEEWQKDIEQRNKQKEIEAKEASRRRAERNKQAADKLNRKSNVIMSALESQTNSVPFSGEEVHQAVQKQREDKLNTWKPIINMADIATNVAGIMSDNPWILGAAATPDIIQTIDNAANEGITGKDLLSLGFDGLGILGATNLLKPLKYSYRQRTTNRFGLPIERDAEILYGKYLDRFSDYGGKLWGIKDGADDAVDLWDVSKRITPDTQFYLEPFKKRYGGKVKLGNTGSFDIEGPNKHMLYRGLALPLGIGLTGYGLNQKRLGGRIKLADGGYVRKRNNTDLFSFQEVANLVDKRRNLINDTVSVKKQPTATPYKPKTNIETGFKTNKNQEVYTVQKGDTLGTISQRYYGNSKKYLDIASANNIKNPDKIEVGDKLVIPKKFDKPLTLKEIPTNNRVSIIDDYSPNYNYIVEGNKIYYSRKGHNDYWVDISDNETARKNLFNHIGTKYNYKGYEDNEMDIGKAVQTGTYDYDKMFQSVKNYNIPEFNPDYSVPVSSIARRNVLIGKQNVNHRNDKPSTTIFDSLSNFFNKGINYVGRQYRKIFGSNEDSSRLELPNQQFTSSAYGIMPASYTGDTINIDNRYIIPESINLNDVRLGTRNRGNVTPINTEGAIITNFNPYQQYSEINKNDKTSTYMGIDKNGKFKVGNIDSFSDGDLLTKTFANDVISFDTQNGKQVWKDDAKHGNRGRSVPVVNVLDKNGNVVKGTINILTNKNSDKSNTYGWVTGGRVILEVGNERRLVSGSIDDIKKQFNDIKKRHNAKSVRIYTLDNGSYNRGLRTKNRLLTSADLKAYDNMNSGGGNFMYIKSGSDVYSTDTVKTPNIRTKNSESYRKGHSDVNERKGVVLHHTAFMDNDLTSVTKHLTNTKSEASSHVIIGFDGHRRVLATPDKVTFHAGNSVWNNRENVNDFMIGIEFQGDTNKKNLTDRQIQSAIEYLKPIIRENNISLENIVTHQQVRDMYNKYAKKQGKPGAASKPDINFENYKRIITELRKQLYYDKNVKREKKRYGGKVKLLYAYN